MASQEANKDIDYLALGIPIIGNHRFPTEEKIYAGCGVFIENESDIKRLISSESMREEISVKCRDYYLTHYSFERFTNGLDLTCFRCWIF